MVVYFAVLMSEHVDGFCEVLWNGIKTKYVNIYVEQYYHTFDIWQDIDKIFLTRHWRILYRLIWNSTAAHFAKIFLKQRCSKFEIFQKQLCSTTSLDCPWFCIPGWFWLVRWWSIVYISQMGSLEEVVKPDVEHWHQSLSMHRTINIG